MTRKQALYIALESIGDNTVIEKIYEIIEELPLTNWSKRTILDSIDQFIIDNGRIPTATDFKKKGLPPHPVIKLRFGINLKEFLAMYYPVLCTSKIYYNKTKEEWKKSFIYDYKKNKPTSAEQFNSTRTVETPAWGTVAKMFGIETWLDWLNFCGLERYSKCKSKPRGSINLKVTSRNDLE